MRTEKKVGNTTWRYIYDGSRLVYMTNGSTAIYFRYDAEGNPMCLKYKGENYFYLRNAQNDIVGIVDSAGALVVEYTYDAWGKPLSTTGSMATTLGASNPLRYRSYFYDTHTGLYYLQSRYYDPEMGRFICADGYVATGQGILGNNMYAYCGNNPVNRYDESGDFWHIVAGAVIGAITNAATFALEVSMMDEKDKADVKWWHYLVAGTIGAAEGALTVAIPGAAVAVGAISGVVDSCVMGAIKGDPVEEIAIDAVVSAGVGAATGSWGSKLSSAGSQTIMSSGANAYKELIGPSRKFVSNAAKKSMKHSIAKSWKLFGKELMSSLGETSVIWLSQKVLTTRLNEYYA